MKDLVIKKNDYQRLIDHCLVEKPLEACGILAGEKENERYQVKKVYIMENTSASSEEYLMEPEEQFEVFKDIRESGLELISIFHSHPHSPSRPSNKDIEMAYYPDAVYIIISLMNTDDIDFRGFIISNKSYEEIEIVVED